MTMASFTANIPKIDLESWLNGSPEQRTRVEKEFRQICHEIGFFYLINHGVENEFLDKHMKVIQVFFDLPLEYKQTIDKSQSPQFRGWEALGSELTNNQVDYREQIDFGPERPPLVNPEPHYMRLVGFNQWPDERMIPGFKDILAEYVEKMTGVARKLLALMSKSLGLSESIIEDHFGRDQEAYIKLIRYPLTQNHGFGVGPHKDSGFLTLLLQDDCGGLEVETQSGKWIPVNPLRGSLVINIGEMLQEMTHHYYVATHHRVINKGTGNRYSSAYFYSPDLNTRLEPLAIDPALIKKAHNSDFHHSAGIMASREELQQGTGTIESRKTYARFGDKYWERWTRSYPEIVRKHHPEMIEPR